MDTKKCNLCMEDIEKSCVLIKHFTNEGGAIIGRLEIQVQPSHFDLCDTCLRVEAEELLNEEVPE